MKVNQLTQLPDESRVKVCSAVLDTADRIHDAAPNGCLVWRREKENKDLRDVELATLMVEVENDIMNNFAMA